MAGGPRRRGRTAPRGAGATGTIFSPAGRRHDRVGGRGLGAHDLQARAAAHRIDHQLPAGPRCRPAGRQQARTSAGHAGNGLPLGHPAFGVNARRREVVVEQRSRQAVGAQSNGQVVTELDQRKSKLVLADSVDGAVLETLDERFQAKAGGCNAARGRAANGPKKSSSLVPPGGPWRSMR